MRILLCGPESSGKTTLAQSLADDLQAVLVPEYARTFLADRATGGYKKSDLLTMLAGQLESEVERGKTNRTVICDTGAVDYYVWSLVKYGKVHPAIEQAVIHADYDVILLLAPDLPWHPDPQRESPLPERRELIFAAFEQLLRDKDLDYTVICGANGLRLASALEVINQRRLMY
ncbi:MAG: ATP-binding protein [Saprospiraceae bacterium]